MSHTKQAGGWIWLIPALHQLTTKLAIVTDVIKTSCDDRNQSVFASAGEVGIYLKEPAGNFLGLRQCSCLTKGGLHK